MLTCIIFKEALMHSKMESIKQSVVARRDFNLIEVFKAIDSNNTRYINFENLDHYLTKNGAVFQEEDVVAFIQRYDKDFDCRLSYMEFMDAILPFDFKGKDKPSYRDPTEASLSKAAFVSPFKNSLRAKKGSSSSKVMNRTIYSQPSGKSLQKSNLITPSKGVEDKGYGKSTEVIQFEPSKPQNESVNTFLTEQAFDVYLKSDMDELAIYKELMQKQINAEKMLELLKQDIAIRNDITIASMYKMFNPDNSSYITPLEFVEGCQRFSLNPTREEIYMLFDRLDKNMDGKLNYKDICNLFVPKQQEYAYIFLSRNDILKEDRKISKESFEAVRKLLNEHIRVERLNKKWKKEINGKGHRKAFEQCDTKGRGFFDITDVPSFINFRLRSFCRAHQI